MNTSTLRKIFWVITTISIVACMFFVTAILLSVRDSSNLFNFRGAGRAILLFAVGMIATMSVTMSIMVAIITKTFQQEKSYLVERISTLEKKLSN